MEKKSIILSKYKVELRDPNMSYEDAMDALEEYLMLRLVESASGELLLRLYYYFGTEIKPLSVIEFFEFWDELSEDPWETLPFLLFAENDLVPSIKENR
jgi:hypothetical protein